MTGASEKKPFLDRLLDAYQGRITAKELKLMQKLVELGTESDEVRKYRLKLDFVRRTFFVGAYFVLVYFVIKLVLAVLVPHAVASWEV